MSTPLLSLLRDGAYARIWLIGLLGNTMRWLEVLAVGIFVFETTGSALQVAVMTVVRQVPLALFGSVTGQLAERVNRGRLLAAAFAVTTLSSSTMCVLAWTGSIELWHMVACAFVSGTCWTMDFPARRTLLGEFCGPERLGAGVSFDSATNNATRMAGPLSGGILYGLLGLEGAFLFSLGAHAACVVVALSLTVGPTPMAAASGSFLRDLRRVLDVVMGSRDLLRIYLFTTVLNVFGFPYAAMIPVLGRARYQVEPALIGLLSAVEGAGAFIGALAISFLVRPRWYAPLFVGGSIVFMTGVICLSLAPFYWVAVALLFGAGLGMAGFGSMQSTLVLSLAPQELRGRLMGLLSVCIGCSPVGLVTLGLLSDWLGPPLALLLMSATGLALLLTIAIKTRN